MKERTMQKQALLPSVIAHDIKQNIIDQQLIPGTKLQSEVELLKLFDVSRPTLREAIKILGAENVVEIRRCKGTFVRDNIGIGNDPLGLDFSNKKHLIQNLFETRILIEPPIAGLAAERRSEKDLVSLRNALNAFSSAIENGGSHADCDVAFHTLIARCSKNDVLFRILPIIIETIRKGSAETFENVSSHKRAMVFHHKLFDAIERQNVALAEDTMRRHIIEAADDAKIEIASISKRDLKNQTIMDRSP
jgi:DNA-binding FadR family transcriptional regulator